MAASTWRHQPPPQPPLPPDSKERQRRLDGNVRHLYHQTSRKNADAILKDGGRMLPGSGGLAGGGIYFAETPEHTDHKALNRGVILEADVRLGRVKHVPVNGAPGTTYNTLFHEGYDSVLIPRQNGHEYVVYNPDQVMQVRVHALRKEQVHVRSFNRRGRFAVQPSGHINF